MTSPTTLPLPSDENDFFTHPKCDNYEANVNGVVRNIFKKNIVGYKMKNGYYQFTCNNFCCRGDMLNKKHQLHRFVYECFHGIIENGKVIDHIDNDKSNNKLDNLQMISQSENSKKKQRWWI